jgi:hypothetical protein
MRARDNIGHTDAHAAALAVVRVGNTIAVHVDHLSFAYGSFCSHAHDSDIRLGYTCMYVRMHKLRMNDQASAHGGFSAK